MGRRELRRHILGYSVCLCPIKGTPGLNELRTNVPLLAAFEGHSDNSFDNLGGLVVQKTEVFENFGGQHCPLSGHFLGVIGGKRGLKCTKINAHFCAPRKTLNGTPIYQPVRTSVHKINCCIDHFCIIGWFPASK